MASALIRACGVASAVWLCVASAHAVAPGTPGTPGTSGRPFDPCVDGRVQLWSGVQLLSPRDAAPRDGLLFQAQLMAVAVGGLPPTASIGVVVQDAAGASPAGMLAFEASYTSPTLAWRPTLPLAAGAQYTIKVVLPNVAPPQCVDPPDVEQTFTITTTSELSPAQAEPPLRAIAYAQTWSNLGAMTCCEPRDRAKCGDAEHCAKCWSARREPTIVPEWDAQSMSTDPVEYGLFFGTLTAIDSTTLNGFGFGSALPNLAFRPLAFPNVVFSETQSEVCMTAAARNFRTGAVALRTRCAKVVDDDSRRVALPAGLMFDPPADATLTIGPAACQSSTAPYERGDVQVAASFHTSRDTCLPGCQQIFPIAPEQPTAGVGGSLVRNGAGGSIAPPPPPGLDRDDTAKHDVYPDGGCQVGGPVHAPSALLLWIAVWFLGRSRRQS